MAQLVEQRIRNAWVGGSSPPSGSKRTTVLFFCCLEGLFDLFAGLFVAAVTELAAPEYFVALRLEQRGVFLRELVPDQFVVGGE